MDENKVYSVDDILSDTRHSGSAHSGRDISAKAQQQADALLSRLRSDTAKSTVADAEFDAFMEALNKRTQKRQASSATQEPAPQETLQQAEPQPVVEPQPETVPAEPLCTESESVSEPAMEPQLKKRHRSLEEVLGELVPEEEQNKIDRALEPQKSEKASRREKHLTNTGIIRKADALIDGRKLEQPLEETFPATTVEGVGRMGTVHKEEKIVGDKEDIQTKAYHAYIRDKEKKKQDTGIIKTIDIKLADPRKAEPHREQAGLEKTIAVTRSKKELVDEETDFEKTMAVSRDTKVISPFHHTGNIEGQTQLEGFFDDEQVEKITEDELEEQLEINRRKKIEAFSFEKEYRNKTGEAVTAETHSRLDDTYAPEKETPVINDVIDYNSKNDKRAIYIELEQLVNRFKLRTILTFAGFLVSAVIGIFASGILPDFGLGTGGERVYIIMNAAILLYLLIINGRAVFKGLKALFLLKPSADSLVAFSGIITLAHCILCFFFGENGAGIFHLYVGAVGFMLLLNCFGKRSMTRRIFKNFRFLIKNGDKYSAACITDPKQIKEFAKGSEQEYYDIRYNAPTAFPSRFLANSFADDPSDTLAKVITYPVIGIAFVVGAVTWLLSKDLVAGISALCAVMLAGVPASSMMSFHKALENADNTLLKERGTVSGFAAANDVAETTAVVLGSDELFGEGYCSLKGMKLYKKMQMDEAILYAASVLEGTKHPLRGVFMESISEVKEKMPASFDKTYESRLGLSAWIYDRKVLLGTKEMMGAHGIEIPANAKPESYIRDNVRVMFLAIDGVVYAMFVVEYFSDPNVEYELQRLEASGIELLVRTEDSNVDEALLSELFDIDVESVKILSILASKLYEEKMEQPVINEAQIINRGDPLTFVRSVIACSVLSGQFRLLKTLHLAAAAIGVIVVSILACVGSIGTIGPVHIAVYAAVWMVITNLIPRIYKAVPKR